MPCVFEIDAAGQKLTIDRANDGDARLRVRYRGEVRRDVTNGFYVSRFGDGKLFTTMMQPTGTRWLLPCLDHPAQKAVFRLRVRAPKELTVISNAAAISSEANGTDRLWTFAPTPKMSSYLLYLGVGPFDLEQLDQDGLTVRVAAAPGKAAQGRNALRLAGPILRAYEQYYHLPYPLGKLDLVGVPDFWAGGMENWGAITFPEVGVLWDDSTSPSLVRWAIETLAHEIAHQWFGDLVTMEWWDDIWLNESFTTFVAAKMTEHLRLRADAWAEFAIRTQPGYSADSMRSTHAIQLTIHDPAEISQSVDDITYFKGANIVRMLEAYLGEESFRTGVAEYLTRFQSGNARSEDLWHALEGASQQPVRRVMRAWVDRPGLPVIEARRSPRGLALRQRRFGYLPIESAEPPWPIPLNVVDGGATRRLLFDTESTELECDDAARVLLNPGRTAFVRVWWEPELRRARIDGLGALAPLDRWAFMNDAAALLLSGDYPLEDYLAGVRAATASTDYPTIEGVSRSLRSLLPHLRHDSAFRETFLAYHRHHKERLGLRRRPGEPDTDPISRESVLVGLVALDDEFARELAAEFPQVDRLDPAARGAAAQAFARVGGGGAADALLELMRQSKSEEAAERASHAIGDLPTAPELQHVLDELEKPGVRTTHLVYAVRSMVGNPEAPDLLWRWLQKNLRMVEKRSEGSWWLSRTLEDTIPFVGLAHPSEVREYFDREKFPEGTNGIRRGLELLEIFTRLRARLKGG